MEVVAPTFAAGSGPHEPYPHVADGVRNDNVFAGRPEVCMQDRGRAFYTTGVFFFFLKK